MFRLSKLADYAAIVLTYLAHHQESIHNATTIAQATGLSAPTVRKLLKLLARPQLLHSIRGTKGGYQLARHPQDISVAEIISAIDEYAGLTECSQHSGSCSLEAICHIQHHWRVIDKAIYTALASVSLNDLIQPLKATKIDISQFKSMLGERRYVKIKTTN